VAVVQEDDRVAGTRAGRSDILAEIDLEIAAPGVADLDLDAHVEDRTAGGRIHRDHGRMHPTLRIRRSPGWNALGAILAIVRPRVTQRARVRDGAIQTRYETG